MILSIARASVEDADRTHMFGIWSDIVVGDRPAGLVDAYLLESEDSVLVHAVWESAEAHDRAVEDKASHPAFGFFEACGLDPAHSVYRVLGRMT